MPGLVLLDLAMPGVNGFEFLKLLRREKELKDLAVTVFSGSNHSPDVNRAYLLGANSFLVKPIEFMKFAAAIKETVEFWLAEGGQARVPVYMQKPEQPCATSQLEGN